jgi:hypothetical protein
MISVMMLPREGGKNEPAALLPGSGSGGNAGSYVWSMQKHKQEIRQDPDAGEENEWEWDELEKSIVSSIADDVSISIDGTTVQITIIKQF